MTDISSNQSGIYKIVNSVSGKVYVGSAVNIRMRWIEHRGDLRKGKHHNMHLQNSWIKHGEASFSFEVIEMCEASALVVREQFWIDHFRAAIRTHGYNISPTAGSVLGMKHTPEARKKMSKAQTGNSKTRGQKRSHETRKKMSESFRGRTFSDEARANMSAAAKRKRLTPEHRAKIGESNKGRVVSSQTRKKISAAHKGKRLSFETRQKISQARKRLSHASRDATAPRQRLLFQ